MPDPVAGCDGSSDRDAGAEVDGIDEHTPIDGMRDGAAESRVVPRPGAAPRGLVRG